MARHRKITADDWARIADERRKLQEAGYQVIEHTPYHWHVTKTGEVVMNVYPTTQKCVLAGDPRTGEYEDISEVIAMLDEFED